jgi:hypothetical protein
MRVKDYFRTYGHIHAIWTIALLIAVIAWLLLGERNGNIINTYISFASSLASLILAVVAIFYAVISNQSHSETIGTLRVSSDSLETAARNIADTSTVLNRRFEDVVGQVAMVPAAVEALSAKLDERAAVAAEAQLPEVQGTDNETLRLFNDMKFGGQVFMYILAKSAKELKAFNTDKVFDKERTSTWDSMLLGFCIAVSGTRPCGIELDDIEYEDDIVYKTRSFGKFSADELITIVDSEQHDKRDDPLYQDIRAYFADKNDEE